MLFKLDKYCELLLEMLQYNIGLLDQTGIFWKWLEVKGFFK